MAICTYLGPMTTTKVPSFVRRCHHDYHVPHAFALADHRDPAQNECIVLPQEYSRYPEEYGGEKGPFQSERPHGPDVVGVLV